MNRYFITLAFIAIQFFGFSQNNGKHKVYTEDIDHFWEAYDSVSKISDSVQRVKIIQALYIDRGTEGLKAFMEARDYTASQWSMLISKYPRFWNSIRPYTLNLKSQADGIEKSIARLRKLYPGLKEARMYFTIGGLNSGGTTWGDMVLIGSEVAMGNPGTDVSEFPNKWLEGVFKYQSPENIIPLNIHEYVHTQQKNEGNNVLAQVLREGACDFITELVIGRPLQNNYLQYGRAHRNELKDRFKEEMFTTAVNRWMYNGSTAETVADLGYFMGYDICKAYYTNAVNKKDAIKKIIELDYHDSAAVEDFLLQSKYYPGPLRKQELLRSYQEKQPVLLGLEPFGNGDTLADPSVREITLVFSKPMFKGYSINMGERGKDYNPITGVAGFSDDKKRLTLKVELKPGKEYEFVVTDKSFRSAEGYPLLGSYTVYFKTRP